MKLTRIYLRKPFNATYFVILRTPYVLLSDGYFRESSFKHSEIRDSIHFELIYERKIK